MSLKTNSEVMDALRESLCLIGLTTRPAVLVGTQNPLMPSSVCAQMIATSATLPFVIHIFEPFITQSDPSFFAKVAIPEGLEPWSASVRPKQPIASPFAIFGNHSCFWASLPNL